MRKQKDNRLRWLAALFISILLAYSLHWVSNFYSDLDDFSTYANNNKVFGVERLIGEKHSDIQSYYDKTDKWIFRWTGLQWLSNKTIFKDAQFYEGVTAYNRGDYDSSRRLLGSLDNYKAKRLAGSAGFHLLREACLGGQCEDENSPLVREVRYNFEEALKNSPDGSFSDIWNYDLVSDSTSLSQAMRQEPTEGVGELQLEMDDDGEEVLPQEDEEQEIDRLPQQEMRGGSGDRGRTP